MQKFRQAIVLCGQPAATLVVEVVRLLNLLILDTEVGHVVNEDAAVEQFHLQHAVKAAHRGIGEHQFAKEVVSESHARADESR